MDASLDFPNLTLANIVQQSVGYVAERLEDIASTKLHWSVHSR